MTPYSWGISIWTSGGIEQKVTVSAITLFLQGFHNIFNKKAGKTYSFELGSAFLVISLDFICPLRYQVSAVQILSQNRPHSPMHRIGETLAFKTEPIGM